ncbi:MAG: helix-turn-helix transcriptional regulator [Anaerolineae bacterium]|nr:helix-turn-helix transcriptional regulator [Anaerolineae bacterium]
MQGRGGGGGHRWRQQGCSRRAVRILEPVLLLLLHHGPAHGYTLLEELEPFGLDEINPSVVYRALRDMEERGWVSSAWNDEQSQGPPRRVYQLAALGDEVLSWWVGDLQETQGMIRHIVKTYQDHMEGHGEQDHHEHTLGERK